MGLLAVQFATLAAVMFNQQKIEAALKVAAARGQDTFTATQVSDLFSSSKSSFTMVNGWKAVNKPNQCSVNLVRSDSGTPVDNSTGFFLEFHAPARRFIIKDCSNLPPRIYRPFSLQ